MLIRHRRFGERPSDLCVQALAQNIERSVCEVRAREALGWRSQNDAQSGVAVLCRADWERICAESEATVMHQQARWG